MFDCEYHKGRKWFLAGTFYAVSPSFRPIPVGMKIFCAKSSTSFPYNTKDMYLMYDPFNIKDDCVYFTTYNQPVPNTKPLYFHAQGDNIFPSFDSHPPSDLTKWTQTRISPVFVMTNKNEKFKCINGRCLPWTSDIKYLYDSDPHDELLSLQNCVIYCNDLVVSKNQGKPFNILEMISNESKKQKLINNKSNQKNIWIFTLLFIITVALIVSIASLKKLFIRN